MASCVCLRTLHVLELSVLPIVTLIFLPITFVSCVNEYGTHLVLEGTLEYPLERQNGELQLAQYDIYTQTRTHKRVVMAYVTAHQVEARVGGLKAAS